MDVILLDEPVQVEPNLYRGVFWTLNYRRIPCGHKIRQPGKDKAGHRRRPRHCRNDATYMRVAEDGWAFPRCTQHQKEFRP